MATGRETTIRVGMGLAAVGAFLLGIRLLGAATGALAPELETVVRGVVNDVPAALGASWLAAILLLNGSVVAAVSLTLFGAGLVTTGQVLVMVAGSRLGAAGVVLVVGALDHFRNPRRTARESMGLGVLAFLATYTIYLPAALVSYLALPWVEATVAVDATAAVRSDPPSVLAPLLEWVLGTLGAPLSFLVALLLLFGGISLFDRLFERLDMSELPRRGHDWLRRPVVSFLIGAGLTAVTTSVAFSLGVVVPLYNRALVDRREMLPFILGASIGTLSDTLLAAVVLGLPAAAVAVVVLLAVSTAFSLGALATFETYSVAVERVYERILGDRTVFAAFLVTLIAVPLAFVLV